MVYVVHVDTGVECDDSDDYETKAGILLNTLTGIFAEKAAVSDLLGHDGTAATQLNVWHDRTLQAEALVEAEGKLDKGKLTKAVRKDWMLAKVSKRESKAADSIKVE